MPTIQYSTVHAALLVPETAENWAEKAKFVGARVSQSFWHSSSDPLLLVYCPSLRYNEYVGFDTSGVPYTRVCGQ